MAALGIDWAALKVPPRLRLIMEGGLPTPDQIAQVLRFFAGPHYSGLRYTAAFEGFDPRGK